MRYFLMVLLLGGLSSQACDFCGCSPATASWDQNAAQPASFLQHTLFMKVVDFNDPTNDLQQSRLIGQLFIGAFAPAERWEVRATLPLMMISNTFAESPLQREWGLGDALLQANFLAVNKQPFGEKSWGHRLLAIGGIELPTGSYAVSEDPLLSNVAFGSRSVDVMLGGIYKTSRFKGNFTAGSTLKLNSTNRNDLRFGHQLAIFAQGGYQLSSGKVKWDMMLGSRVDVAGRNILSNIYQNKTGGTLWQLSSGINASTGQWGFGLLYQQPLLQNNGGGVFKHQPTFFTNLIYQFKRKQS
jgi:hypothetical protein